MRGRFLLVVTSLLLLIATEAGIAGFWRWFKGHYKDVVTNVSAGNFATFDHVLVDLNQLVHKTARRSNSTEDAIAKLMRELSIIRRTLRPRKSLVLAFDGPAPRAKLITQRKRRCESVDDESASYVLHLSPGTEFMRRAAEAVEAYIVEKLESDERLRHVTYYLSSSDCPGEGEVKLMDWINRFIHTKKKRKGKGGDPDESIVVVGGDADLVLQGLALPGLPDFHVFVPELKRQACVVSLRNLVHRLDKLYPAEAHNVCNDMVVLLAMAGNDYLPKLRGTTFTLCMNMYEQIKRQPEFHGQFLLDPTKKTFNWSFLQAFMEALALRSRVQDLSVVINQKPTAVCLLSELVQRKLLPPYSVTYDLHGSKSTRPSFSCDLRIGEYVFSSGSMTNKKESKQRAACAALMALSPEVYQRYLEIQGAEAKATDGDSADPSDAAPAVYVQPSSIFVDEGREVDGLVLEQLLPLNITPYAFLHELYQKKMIPSLEAEIEGAGDGFVCKVEIGNRTFSSQGERSHRLAKHGAAVVALRCLQPAILVRACGKDPSIVAPLLGYTAAYDLNEENGEPRGEEEAATGGGLVEDGGEETLGEDEDEEEDEDEDELEEEELDEEVEGDDSLYYDPELYLRGLLWNFQMYSDGYCPDYNFSYTHRFAPTAEELATFVRERRGNRSDWTLAGPVSEAPPHHAAVACMAVMPRSGLHLVPDNLSDILQLPSCRDVDRMFNPGEAFVLESLLEAVKRERADLARCDSFFWKEIHWHPQYTSFLRPKAKASEGEPGPVGEGKEGRVIVNIVPTTSAPPCRSWRKSVSSSRITAASPRQTKWSPVATKKPIEAPSPPPPPPSRSNKPPARRVKKSAPSTSGPLPPPAPVAIPEGRAGGSGSTRRRRRPPVGYGNSARRRGETTMCCRPCSSPLALPWPRLLPSPPLLVGRGEHMAPGMRNSCISSSYRPGPSGRPCLRLCPARPFVGSAIPVMRV